MLQNHFMYLSIKVGSELATNIKLESENETSQLTRQHLNYYTLMSVRQATQRFSRLPTRMFSAEIRILIGIIFHGFKEKVQTYFSTNNVEAL